MKSHHHTTSDEAGPSLEEIGTWPLALICLHQRLAPYFTRPEPYHHALLYLQAIISEIKRKNSWQIAEHAKQARPYGMQRLLSRAVWDDEGVRDEMRTFLLHCLNPPSLLQSDAVSCDGQEAPFPVLVMDESGFPKRGTKSAGVQVQHCGATGHGLIDCELYLPEIWCTDAARRQAAHLPQTVTFRTKPELATRMVQRAQAAALPIRWVVADTVYGHSTNLRLWLEEQGLSYAASGPLQ